MAMKFYTQPGIPNPDVVHMYIAETGCQSKVDQVAVNVGKAENRQADYLKLNPLGEVPCLIMPNGTALSESTTIAKYLDELQGFTSVYGKNAEERAMTDMWLRRVEEKVTSNMARGFQCGPMAEFFKDRRPGFIHPEIAQGMRTSGMAGLKWLDEQLADGRQFLCGDRFSLADIRLCVLVNFFTGRDKNQPFPSDLKNFERYFKGVQSRPSAVAIAPKPKAKL